MKAIPLRLNADLQREQCPADQADAIQINIPGPVGKVVVEVHYMAPPNSRVVWRWNGSTTRPTLDPTLLYHLESGGCTHVAIRDGKVRFLKETTHARAGQTMELLEV